MDEQDQQGNKGELIITSIQLSELDRDYLRVADDIARQNADLRDWLIRQMGIPSQLITPR